MSEEETLVTCSSELTSRVNLMKFVVAKSVEIVRSSVL